MPIIRNQITKLKIDFKSPTKDDLRKLVDALIEVTEQIINVDTAKEERRIFKELLKKIGVSAPEPF